MSTPSSSPLPSSSGYTPPLELFHAAVELLQGATPTEIAAAARAYGAYSMPTGGRSAITGAELPDFGVCTPLVRAGWLSVARALCPSSVPLHVDVSALKPELDRLQEMVATLTAVDQEGETQVDPFLLGCRDIAVAMRDLASAAQLAQDEGPAELIEAIKATAVALHERVKALAPSSAAS
jgi:hypothetical protein